MADSQEMLELQQPFKEGMHKVSKSAIKEKAGEFESKIKASKAGAYYTRRGLIILLLFLVSVGVSLPVALHMSGAEEGTGTNAVGTNAVGGRPDKTANANDCIASGQYKYGQCWIYGGKDQHGNKYKCEPKQNWKWEWYDDCTGGKWHPLEKMLTQEECEKSVCTMGTNEKWDTWRNGWSACQEASSEPLKNSLGYEGRWEPDDGRFTKEDTCSYWGIPPGCKTWQIKCDSGPNGKCTCDFR